MTPAQLAALSVAWDGLRTAGFDEATLARMERAVKPDIEDGLASALRLMDDAADFRNGNTHNGIDEGSVLADRVICRLRVLLPADVTCRSPSYVCAGRPEDCWCAGLPGAGAG